MRRGRQPVGELNRDGALAAGVVDDTGPVRTIYGAPARDAFPASVTRCLTGVQVTSATTVLVADSCAGILVELRREPH